VKLRIWRESGPSALGLLTTERDKRIIGNEAAMRASKRQAYTCSD